MKIVGSITVEDYIGRFFTNYNLAYAGEQFSEAFLKWVDDYVNDTQNAYNSCSTSYVGKVCSIKASYYRLPSGEVFMYISSIVFYPITITRLLFQSHAERVAKGLPSTPPRLISSTRKVSDYSYYSDGGTYGRHVIDIVRKKGSSRRKPLFNYYDRNSRAIMFDYGFYSPFPFDGDEAEAWATDGHKYKLPYMYFIESRNTTFQSQMLTEAFQRRLNRIITETLNRVISESILKENLNKKKPTLL